MNTETICTKKNSCDIECNGGSDMLACNALQEAKQCPVCKSQKDRFRIHNVTNPDDNYKFMFVKCNCGYTGDYHRALETEVDEFDYIKTVEKWNK